MTWQQLKKMVQGLLKQLTANFTEVTLSTNTQKQKPLIFPSHWYGTAYQSLFYFTIYNTMKRPQRFNQILISSAKQPWNVKEKTAKILQHHERVYTDAYSTV